MSVDRYAVFGNPVAHSKSPEIHRAFAAQTGQKLEYDKQLVEVGGFDAAADAFFQGGGKGLNVTVPFKADAFNYARKLTDRARLAGAVNTLALDSESRVVGDNTDGAGLVADMTRRLGWTVEDKRVLVLGAGGAVRGVLHPLLQANPKAVVVANRTANKALTLADIFADYGEISGCGFALLEGQQFDVVINGTSAGLTGDLPPLPDDVLTSDACAYDMMYGDEPTAFIRWAKAHGAARVSDGLGMLVGQAAESFRLWRGVFPDVGQVLSQLRTR